MAPVTNTKTNNPNVFDYIFSKINFGTKPGTNIQTNKTVQANIDINQTGNQISATADSGGQNIGIDINKNTGDMTINTNNPATNNYLNSVLSKIGITQPTDSNVIPNNSLSNILGDFGNPSAANNPGGMFGNSANGILNFSQILCQQNGGANCNSAKQQASQALSSLAQSTSYKGTGGTLPGDCGIPAGPIAYNIGGEDGDGVQCSAKTIIVGFDQNFKPGFFPGGYVNPMLEKGVSMPGASIQNCKGSTDPNVPQINTRKNAFLIIPLLLLVAFMSKNN